MDFKSKNINWLTPLLRWISGEATLRDEQSLERAAQEDPFLADALDGYRSLPAGEHAAAVTRLKAQLRRRHQQRRGIGFYLLRAAAIAVVLVAAWAVFSQFDPNKTSRADMAEVSEKVAQAPAPTAATGTETPENFTGTQDEISPAPAFSQKKSKPEDALLLHDGLATAELVPPPSRPALEAMRTTEALSEADVAAVDTAARSAMADDTVQKNKERDETAEVAKSKNTDGESPAGANALSAPQMKVSPPRNITGQVTDGSGNPLIGATVLAKGASTRALTDTEGRYSINLPLGSSSLQFSYTGYTSMEIGVGDTGRLDVKLTESGETLSEVVVTELGKDRKRQVAPPTPKGGFKKFEKYIQVNMRRPDAGAAVPASGMVTVAFRILPNGSLTDFQPTGPLGQEFKDEAVRLLREGPAWQGVPNSFTTFTIRF